MALILIALSVVAYALVSRRLASTPVTGAMIFMVIGVLLGPSALDVIHGGDRHVIALLLEVALALVLFTDSLAISAGNWRAKSRLPSRLLLIGMPLTMIIGWVLGLILFPGIDVWALALVAICLAPTDAALGQAVVTSPKVPSAIRQALNIESGLNDGLALPFFVLALAAAIESSESGAPGLVEVFARSLVLAAIVGGVLGWLGGVAIGWSRDRGWVGREWSQIATVALVFLAFTIADTAQGSGFIATWVAGVTFGRAIKDREPDAALFAEDLGGLLFALLSFLGFSADPARPTPRRRDMASHRVRGAQPHRRPDASRRHVAPGDRPGQTHRHLRRMVRSTRSRVDRVRLARRPRDAPRGLDRPAGDLRDRRAERGTPRRHGRLGSEPLRQVVRGGEGCRSPPTRKRRRR